MRWESASEYCAAVNKAFTRTTIVKQIESCKAYEAESHLNNENSIPIWNSHTVEKIELLDATEWMQVVSIFTTGLKILKN